MLHSIRVHFMIAVSSMQHLSKNLIDPDILHLLFVIGAEEETYAYVPRSRNVDMPRIIPPITVASRYREKFICSRPNAKKSMRKAQNGMPKAERTHS